MLAANSRAHVDCVSRVLKNADRLPQAPVPALILDSWRRSMELYRLDPGSQQGPRILSQSLLNECRERAELFLRIASDAVARLHERVRGADYCVLLTDAQGRTIDYRVESAIRNDCRKAGLYLGTCWSEGEEGTCGVAAVLTSKAPVTVHKRDHFRAAFIGLTCTAAPVFDPLGELLGVVDVSALQSPDDRRSQHLIRQLVEQTAREIENAFFMHSAQGHWVMRAHGTPGYVESQPDYLLAWDADGRLQAINSLARQRLVQHLGRLPEHIGELFDMGQLRRVNTSSAQRLPGLGGLYGRVSAPQQRQRAQPLQQAQDARIEHHLRLATRVKDCNLAVLVQGETGAGKEVFARQLHQQSQRRDGPFVTLNCAAIPENLIESELFGYVAGAFTGASSKGMQGLLQQADGGTLFLDEIGDMPLNLQTRLLRVLAEGEVAPLGAARRERVDIQVICATHRDLAKMVAEGRFREDLYFRLANARFELPPLREREDRLGLIHQLLAEEAQACSVEVVLADAALQSLLLYRWPGNLRQLRQVLRYACAVSEGGQVQLQDLPQEVRGDAVVSVESGVSCPARQLLLDALIRHRWKPADAARALGISRATLYRRVHEHCIEMPRMKG
ncbi:MULTISPECIES: sigma-54-dependent Fis family transcriptional regulator [Pseudomonas]|jgi:transcriptional regulator of acetoin/glycerol metabolism|uniref:Transcriptional regulator AcoR n=1 Tax=Pseudomonas putida NBRC 14164 TaxID=1211579 RepID=A0ABN5UGK9_PSEPU|nr:MULTISPECIES: sigma-54-dependent Fis family transcriptional regulator [Pseudomonas]EKT4463034.1 sigma-54-dependent Fis family transcriptional regulator [Pseudomonas putida]EKT4555395.1 sigma-54-dependent Fis family transcriptional regulator [Pseudomonas putida]MCX9135984.1 sigma-54-dependent Fis family transcriptional regulator [Pseudomonas sp. DCB_PUT]MDD1971958.1 sigma-54-dependent Fis family transcriptional regulator [Pseudomonas putida]MDO1464076.1 sigma-54-dependent Fis family transcri